MNTFARSMDGEVEGAMPFNMRLEFVKRLDRAELDPKKETVIVRIRGLEGAFDLSVLFGDLLQDRRFGSHFAEMDFVHVPAFPHQQS